MDEIWTFIGNKNNVTWITYAIERKSKSIVGFVLGSKTKYNIQPLVNELILSVPKHIYTDGLNYFIPLLSTSKIMFTAVIFICFNSRAKTKIFS